MEQLYTHRYVQERNIFSTKDPDFSSYASTFCSDVTRLLAEGQQKPHLDYSFVINYA